MAEALTVGNQNPLIKKALLELRELKSKIKLLEKHRDEAIAIVGVGCRFPYTIDTPDAFWKALIDGVDATTKVPDGRWAAHPSCSDDVESSTDLTLSLIHI